MEQIELILVDALDKIQQTIDDSQMPRWRNDDRLRIINSDIIADMIADIKTQLPEEIRRANSILLQSDSVLQEAHDYAKRLTTNAENSAAEVTETANKNAQKVRQEADTYHNDKVALGDDYLKGRMADGDKYYNESIARAKQEADEIIAAANAERDRLVSEHEVTLEAQRWAQEHRREMVLRAERVYTNATSSANDVLSTLLSQLEEYYTKIEADKRELEMRLAEHANKNRPAEAGSQRRGHHQHDGEQDRDYDEKPGQGLFFDLFKRRKRTSDSDYEDMNGSDGDI